MRTLERAEELLAQTETRVAQLIAEREELKAALERMTATAVHHAARAGVTRQVLPTEPVADQCLPVKPPRPACVGCGIWLWQPASVASGRCRWCRGEP